MFINSQPIASDVWAYLWGSLCQTLSRICGAFASGHANIHHIWSADRYCFLCGSMKERYESTYLSQCACPVTSTMDTLLRYVTEPVYSFVSCVPELLCELPLSETAVLQHSRRVLPFQSAASAGHPARSSKLTHPEPSRPPSADWTLSMLWQLPGQLPTCSAAALCLTTETSGCRLLPRKQMCFL